MRESTAQARASVLSHGPPHSRGRVAAQDAEHVRDAVDSVLGYPSTTGQLQDGTVIEDSWLQPSGETDEDGAPVYVQVTGGTLTHRQLDETGEYLVTHFEAALVNEHGSARARAAVQAALERGPTTVPPDVPPGPPPRAPGNLGEQRP